MPANSLGLSIPDTFDPGAHMTDLIHVNRTFRTAMNTTEAQYACGVLQVCAGVIVGVFCHAVQLIHIPTYMHSNTYM